MNLVIDTAGGGGGSGIGSGFGTSGFGGFDGGGGSGGGVNWSSVNTGVSAFGLGNGIKTGLLDYAGKTGELTKGTTNYLNASKLLGRGVYGVTIANSGIQTWNAWSNSDRSIYTNDNNKWGVTGKAGLDVVMGYVGFLGPIGFGFSATYFILDAAGVFDSWSQPTN